MEIIPDITKRLNDIILPEGQLPRAAQTLNKASEQLSEGWNNFYEVMGGSTNPEAQDIIVAMTKARAAVSQAEKMIAAAAGGIAVVRNRITGMPEDVEPRRVQILQEPDGRTYRKRHPDAQIQILADQAYDQRMQSLQKVRDAIDLAPNLNDRFRDEIEQAQRHMQALGLPIVPIVVLSNDKFNEVLGDVAGQDDLERKMGNNVAGRIVVNGDTKYPTMKSEGKKRLVFDFIVHEMAHQSGYNPRVIVHSHEDSQGERVFRAEDSLGGFTKTEVGETIVHKGRMIEEGFAELTATKMGMQARTRVLHFEGHKNVFGDITYVGGEPEALPQLDGPIEMPTTFLIAEEDTTEGDIQIVRPEAGPIAYGIHLMDQCCPGLYDDMVAARTDPKRQADYIKKIESIEPGLYRKLRDMPYSDEGAKQALRIIGQAITNSRIK